MSDYFEKIPLFSKATYIIREYSVRRLDFPKHYHHEYELIYISKGRGNRYIGDHISELHDGDPVLIGPDLPHHWTNLENTNTTRKIRQVITQLHPRLLGEEFFERIESVEINKLLEKAAHGISFNTNTAARAGRLLETMLKVNNRFEGLILLLKVLHVLSTTSDFTLLSINTFTKTTDQFASDRIEPVYEYIIQCHTSNLTITQLADKFCMSVSAMSHFIRKKTGKNFTDLLLGLRINNACKMLVESDKPVSAICFESGFNNLSYFNRKFKEIRNTTPLAFRRLFDHKFGIL